jgi:hypothetical protein
VEEEQMKKELRYTQLFFVLFRSRGSLPVAKGLPTFQRLATQFPHQRTGKQKSAIVFTSIDPIIFYVCLQMKIFVTLCVGCILMFSCKSEDPKSADLSEEINVRASLMMVLYKTYIIDSTLKSITTTQITPLSADTAIETIITEFHSEYDHKAKLVRVGHTYSNLHFEIIYYYVKSDLIGIEVIKFNRIDESHFGANTLTAYFFNQRRLLGQSGENLGYSLDYLKQQAEYYTSHKFEN